MLKVPDSSSFMPVKLLDPNQRKTGATHGSIKPKDFERVELANVFSVFVHLKQKIHLPLRDFDFRKLGLWG